MKKQFFIKPIIIQSIIVIFFFLSIYTSLFYKNFFTIFYTYGILLLNGLVLFFLQQKFEKKNKSKLFLLFSIIAIIFYFVQFFSFYFHFPLGRIFFLDGLNMKLLGVPIVLSLNTSLILLSSYYISDNFIKVEWLKILAASLIFVFFDFVFEPMAIKYNFWVWFNHLEKPVYSAPALNYFSLFIVSLLINFLIKKFGLRLQSKVLFTYWFAQLFFYQFLQIFR